MQTNYSASVVLNGRLLTLEVANPSATKKRAWGCMCARFLALVCRLPHEHFEKPGLLDYNFDIFKKAVTEVRSGAHASKRWSRRLGLT